MHPTTLAMWGDTNWLLKPLVLQSPFGILFSIATTGHVLYTLFTVTTSGTLSVTLHVSWGQVWFTTQLWSLSFRFSGPLLGPTWLSPWCQKLCPHPFPSLPFPPSSHNFWEVLVSPIFQTDAPTPPGVQGFTITCTVIHVSPVIPVKNLAVRFKKIKTFT